MIFMKKKRRKKNIKSSRKCIIFIRYRTYIHMNIDIPYVYVEVRTCEMAVLKSYGWSRCCINISLGATTEIKARCSFLRLTGQAKSYFSSSLSLSLERRHQTYVISLRTSRRNSPLHFSLSFFLYFFLFFFFLITFPTKSISLSVKDEDSSLEENSSIISTVSFLATI